MQGQVHAPAHPYLRESIHTQADAPIAGCLLPVLHVLHLVGHELVDLVEVRHAVEERLVEHALGHHVFRPGIVYPPIELLQLFIRAVLFVSLCIGFKEDGTSDLFNKKAEFVASGDYDYCSYYEMARVAFCSTHTDRRDIVDLDDKKVKASLTGESINYVRYGYIVVMDPDKISYYTIDGKLFHEFANAYEDYEEESE